jgi:hypothetical protein
VIPTQYRHPVSARPLPALAPQRRSPRFERCA